MHNGLEKKVTNCCVCLIFFVPLTKQTFEAYEYVFGDATALWRSYAVTGLYAIIGTVISVVVMAMFGYSLSRDNYVLKKPLVYYTLFTMLFSGGLVPVSKGGKFGIINKKAESVADFVFDGVLADVYMQSKIMTSIEQIKELRRRLEILREKLRDLSNRY